MTITHCGNLKPYCAKPPTLSQPYLIAAGVSLQSNQVRQFRLQPLICDGGAIETIGRPVHPEPAGLN